MAVGSSEAAWDMDDPVRMLVERAPKLGSRGPYKK